MSADLLDLKHCVSTYRQALHVIAFTDVRKLALTIATISRKGNLIVPHIDQLISENTCNSHTNRVTLRLAPYQRSSLFLLFCCCELIKKTSLTSYHGWRLSFLIIRHLISVYFWLHKLSVLLNVDILERRQVVWNSVRTQSQHKKVWIVFN